MRFTLHASIFLWFEVVPIVSKFMPFVSCNANIMKNIPKVQHTANIDMQPYRWIISIKIGNNFVDENAKIFIAATHTVKPNVRD